MTNSKNIAETVKAPKTIVAKPEAKKAAAPKVDEKSTVLVLATIENPGKQFKVLDKKLELSESTKIKMTQANPKRPSSKIYQTYEMYKSAKTIGQYAEKFGKGWQAGVKYDYQHGFLTIS